MENYLYVIIVITILVALEHFAYRLHVWHRIGMPDTPLRKTKPQWHGSSFIPEKFFELNHLRKKRYYIVGKLVISNEAADNMCIEVSAKNYEVMGAPDYGVILLKKEKQRTFTIAYDNLKKGLDCFSFHEEGGPYKNVPQTREAVIA